jgi:hypothetical protein
MLIDYCDNRNRSKVGSVACIATVIQIICAFRTNSNSTVLTTCTAIKETNIQNTKSTLCSTYIALRQYSRAVYTIN